MSERTIKLKWIQVCWFCTEFSGKKNAILYFEKKKKNPPVKKEVDELRILTLLLTTVAQCRRRKKHERDGKRVKNTCTYIFEYTYYICLVLLFKHKNRAHTEPCVICQSNNNIQSRRQQEQSSSKNPNLLQKHTESKISIRLRIFLPLFNQTKPNQTEKKKHNIYTNSHNNIYCAIVKCF